MSEEMVQVRWLGEHVIQLGTGGPRVLPGGTFQMPRAEAEQRDDVEVVEPENTVVIADEREPEPDVVSPPEHEPNPDHEAEQDEVSDNSFDPDIV